MGNSKNKKVPKKPRASNNKRKTSSDQKENMPKNEKTRATKPEPNDGIALSKQLLLKKRNVRTQRRPSSKPEKICPNGKPLPSLSELEKMFEDSDDDDQTPKPPQKPTCTTSTPEKQTTISNSEKNLLSPTTINKITERLLGSIQKRNLPDPSELLEATSLFREKSPPPPPIIPPKKRKKPEVPYIVGCKDRPKVIRKPNTNFCKGDDDYGVEASSEDPEEQTPTKRAKKSRIPNYSKSIFNAHSDEIAERLTKDSADGLSDASSDSNKTIEYFPTLFQNPRPHSFSPLPSTSTDSETFRKNDELFNESLKEINITIESTPKINEDNLPMTELSTPKNNDGYLVTKQLTPEKRDDILITKQSTLDKEEDDVLIIDIPYDTIVIEDVFEKTALKQHTSNTIPLDTIEIIEPVESEVLQPKKEAINLKIPNDSNDEDCMIVNTSETIKNYNNEPIVVDDEYSSINMEFDSFNNEPIEIIDVDDIIAENKCILDKWKNFGAKELNTMNTVVDVPTTYRNVTVALQTTATPSTTVQATIKPSTSIQTTENPSSTLHASVTHSSTPNTSTTPNTNNNLNITNGSIATNSQNNQRQPTSVGNTQRTVTFQNILHDFFKSQCDRSTGTTAAVGFGNEISALLSNNVNFHYPQHTVPRTRPTSNSNRISSHSIHNPVPIATNRQRFDVFDLIEPNNSSSHSSGTQQTNTTIPPPSPVPSPKNSSSHSSGTQQTSTTIPPPSPVPSRNIGDCPICLDPLASSNGIASTICGHVFCLKCIQASVKTNGKKCPTCRKALKGAGGGYHQLYL